ncbi:sensor histidine kinase [Phenylobacterium sp. VNQ135]|uniref:sensor histidine kinase n=1 Tax=Phenylobacterium sp. VNQ135 TaxID=3400922 RepID=UPI003C0362B5
MPHVRYRAATRRRRRRGAGFARAWHALFALAVAGLGAALAALGLLAAAETAALAAVFAAAVFGVLLAGLGAPGRVIAIIVWAVAATFAVQLTGGAGGPLAAWCLTPLAAAAAFRRAELLALGAAAAVGVAGVCALGGALLPLPGLAGPAAGWLSLAASVTTVLGLAAALIGLQVAAAHDARARDETELELREALDHQPQQVLALDAHGRILTAFGPDLMGLRPYRRRDQPFGDLVALEHRLAVDDALQTAAREGSAELFLAPASDPAGWLELSLKRLTGNRLAAALRDARPQRARELELEQARASAEQQNAGKSRFLANMSHELRTPLNAIMGFSDIMRQRLFGPMADRYTEYAELIHESGSHLLELINDVLDMSKIEAERFELAREEFDVRDAVGAVLRLMRGQAERAGVTLRGVLPTEPLEADADRRAIKQITLNLVSNALKFTPRGGTVTVTAQADGDVLELVVTDSGVGIAPDDLERLGRPFEQAGDAQQRAAGSGLGLSLVRAFAALHGGDMTIDSRVGDGTTVTVRMPVLALPAIEAPAPAAEA